MRRVLILAAAVVALGACHKGARVTAVNPNGDVRIQGADGTVVQTGRNVPTNMPAYLKVVPGAQVQSSISTSDKGGMVVFSTNTPPDQIVDFYKKAAAAAGLTSTMDSAAFEQNSGSNTHTLVFHDPKDNKRGFTASVMNENGSTKVSLLYGS